jgi:hypothetical protein
MFLVWATQDDAEMKIRCSDTQAQLCKYILWLRMCCSYSPTVAALVRTYSLMESFRTLGNYREASGMLLQCIYMLLHSKEVEEHQ